MRPIATINQQNVQLGRVLFSIVVANNLSHSDVDSTLWASLGQ